MSRAVRDYVLLALGLALVVVVFLMATAPVREIEAPFTPATAAPPVPAHIEEP